MPNLISLSPLSTSHPKTFQRSWVRASGRYYPTFTLLMDRSSGFGFSPRYFNALFILAFASPSTFSVLSSQRKLTRRLILQKAHGDAYTALPYLVGIRFQVLFHPGPPVLFTFPSRYLSSIGHRLVFSLGEWSPRIPTRLHVSRGTQDPHRRHQGFRLRGFHPLWPAFPKPFFYPDAL